MSVPMRDTVVKIKKFHFSLLSCMSYVFDWALYTLMIVLGMWWRRGNPRYHEFNIQDESISHTYYNDLAVMLTDLMLLTLSIGVPVLLAIVVYGFDHNQSVIRRLWNMHNALLSLLAMHAYQTVVVTIFKLQLGVARPDMLQRCSPSSFALPPLGMLNNVGICNNPNLQLVRDGFESFPSGHSTTSFASAIFCFYLIATKYKIFDGRCNTTKIVLAVLPIKLALFIAASRYSDNRHFMSDLIAGAVIGSGISHIGYRMYFPSIFDEFNAGMALPPRRLASNNPKKLFWRLEDDPEYHYGDDASYLVELDADVSEPSSAETDTTSASPHPELARGNHGTKRSRVASRAGSRAGSRRYEV